MNTDVHFSSNTDNWSTPEDFFQKLDEEFGFDLDPCASHENHKCDQYFTKEDDGLSQDWSDHTVFMNPPYGEPENVCRPNCKKKTCKERDHCCTEYVPGIIDWMKQAHTFAHAGAATVVCLVPSRTDTKWWHENVIEPGYEVRFVKGRLKFGGCKNSAPFPSAVVVMRNGKEKS